MFMARSKIYQSDNVTSALFNSEAPFVFAAAKQGGVVVRCNNWGSVNNSLDITVQWGEKALGLLGNAANITWATDSTLTTTITGAAGATTPVVGFIKVPQMASKYMRLVFALSGTSQEVDVVAWFSWQSK